MKLYPLPEASPPVDSIILIRMVDREKRWRKKRTKAGRSLKASKERIHYMGLGSPFGDCEYLARLWEYYGCRTTVN